MFILAKRMLQLTAVLLLSSVACGQVVVHEIPSPSANATGLCWDGSGLWVSDYSATLRKVDPVTGAVLRTLPNPVSGSRGLAFENGYLWTISRVSSDRRVFKMDTLTGAVVDTLIDPTNGWAGGMTWDGAALWFSVYYPQDQIMKVDPNAGDTLSLFPSPSVQPYGMAWDGAALWNCAEDSGADRVFRINPTTGALLWTFNLPAHSSGQSRRPRGMAWDGETLWIIAYNQTTFDVKIYQYNVGNAINPDIDFSSTGHDYGAIVVGFPAEWTTTCTNIGNVPLRLDSAVLLGTLPYQLLQPSSFPITIATDELVDFTIRFDPQAPGTFIDTLMVYSNDPDEQPFKISLAGIGLPDEGNIELDPSNIPFGQVRINSTILSTTRELNILNIGSGTLTVTGIELDGDTAFYTDPIAFPLVIDSNSVYTTRVWFNPTEVREYGAVLLISSDDPDEPVAQAVLSGVGSDLPAPGGEVMWYFEASGGFDNGFNSVKAIGDVNGDGISDVAAASDNRLVYCLNGSSTQLADTFWTYNIGANPNHSGTVYYERGMAACPDLTGDGVGEVIIGTSGGSRSVYALSGTDGTELWMFDTREWGEGGWVYEVQPIEDVNGDFVPDVLGCAGDDTPGTGPKRVFALSGASGQLLWSAAPSAAFFTVRTIDDVTGDGIADVVAGDTDGNVFGYSGTSGAPIWSATVGDGSPVFALLPMGNANPGQTQTEDIFLASAYEGVYCLDGGNGAQIWFVATSHVYEVAVGGDITGDDVKDVCYGLVSGQVACLDGTTGAQIWTVTADPNSPTNVLSITTIPDVTRDNIPDIVCGTLGRNIVLLNGWDGSRVWYTIGMGPSSAIDALDVLPDIDGNNSWEILAGHRSGLIEALSGGVLVDDIRPPVDFAADDFALGTAYPNPFNASTTIPYALGHAGEVTLVVYDLLGREVTKLVNAVQPAGTHYVFWQGDRADGTPVSSGMYFVRMQSGSFSATKKIMLLK